MNKDDYILKPNSLINSYAVEKGVEVVIQGQTLLFKEMELDILNILLKQIQQSLFYNNIDDYKEFNPFSVSVKGLKKELNINSNNYIKLIKDAIIGLKEKDIVLRNFTHPTRTNDLGEYIKYSEFHTSIFSNIGFRINKKEIVEDKINANTIIDIELDNIFYYLLKKPTLKHKKFSKYELFVKYKKKKDKYLSEDDIKKEYDLLIDENKKPVNYTLINEKTVKSLKSKYSKKLYELLSYKLSYQIKSKKTVSYDYFKYDLFEINLLFGINETGMTYINKIFKRNFDEVKEKIVKEFNLNELQYESYNSDKQIIFTFSVNK